MSRTQDVLVVSDLREDSRFVESPLIQAGIRFYAGAPLITRDGYALGSMCVLDQTPRTAFSEQVSSLRDLAAMVMAQIEPEHDFGCVDPLSGLSNRHQFVDDLKDLENSQPGAERVAMLVNLIDPKRLQEMLSVMGPICVDDMIRASSRILKDTFGHVRGLYHVDAVSYALLLDETVQGLRCLFIYPGPISTGGRRVTHCHQRRKRCTVAGAATRCL